MGIDDALRVRGEAEQKRVRRLAVNETALSNAFGVFEQIKADFLSRVNVAPLPVGYWKSGGATLSGDKHRFRWRSLGETGFGVAQNMTVLTDGRAIVANPVMKARWETRISAPALSGPEATLAVNLVYRTDSDSPVGFSSLYDIRPWQFIWTPSTHQPWIDEAEYLVADAALVEESYSRIFADFLGTAQ